MRLTPSVINREALVLFVNRVGSRAEPIGGGNLAQISVDADIHSGDLDRSLDEFSTRIIVPAIEALADAIPAGALFLSELMELPKGGMGAASDRFRGVAMRTVIGDYLEPVYAPGALDEIEEGDDMPDLIGIEECLIVRFDVRIQKPSEQEARP